MAHLAAAAATPLAHRRALPFTLVDPERQLEEVVRFFALGVTLGVMKFVQGLAGVVAVVALAARSVHSTRALFGGGFAALGFLVQALRGVWFAAVEPSAGILFAASPDGASRQAMVVFLHHNLLFQHLFNWSYIFFGGVGFAFLAWALWEEAERVAAAFALAAAVHACYFPLLMSVHYSTRVLERPFPLLMLLAESAVWLFPGLAFLLAFLWLKQLAESGPRGPDPSDKKASHNRGASGSGPTRMIVDRGGTERMAEKPPEGRPESERRVRRATPLGLMGPPEGAEPPRASGLPSLRAVGIMVAFMALAVLLVLIFARGC